MTNGFLSVICFLGAIFGVIDTVNSVHNVSLFCIVWAFGTAFCLFQGCRYAVLHAIDEEFDDYEPETISQNGKLGDVEDAKEE